MDNTLVYELMNPSDKEPLQRPLIKAGQLVAFDYANRHGIAIMAGGDYYYIAYNISHWRVTTAKRMPDEIELYQPSDEDVELSKRKFDEIEFVKAINEPIINYLRTREYWKSKAAIRREKDSLASFLSKLVSETKRLFKHDKNAAIAIRNLMILMRRNDVASEIDAWLDEAFASIVRPDQLIVNELKTEQVNEIHGNSNVYLGNNGNKG